MNFYAEKTPDYFSAARTEILGLLPEGVGRVLEIGCGTGDTLAMLKHRSLCTEAVGVESFASAARLAAGKADRVHCLDVESAPIPESPASFDLVLALDVLEHLVDPWRVLSSLRTWLTPRGRLIVSLPNAQHFSLVLPLLRGRFDYAERGILDRTHLRFFTRRSAEQMLRDAAFAIERTDATSLALRLRSGQLNAVTLGLFKGFLASQYVFLCKPVRA